MKLLYSFLILSLIQIASSECAIVKCDSKLPAGVCYEKDSDDDVIKIGSCGSNQVCEVNRIYSFQTLDLDKETAECVDEDYVSEDKYPGESCNLNKECINKQCKSGKCVGLKSGDRCDNSEQCVAGYSCRLVKKSGTCRKQEEIGGDCTTSSDCVNNGICFRGTCREYFSLKNGEQFESIEEAYSLLCESGYFDATFTCRKAPKNERRYNQACDSNADCELEFDSDKTLFGQCACGMNEDGSAFCKAQPGDEEFLNFKIALINLTKINNNCHIAIAFSPRCEEIADTFELDEFLTAYYRYVYRHYLIAQPKCVTETITPFAVGYDTDEYISEAEANQTLIIVVLIVVFTIIALVGFTCFVCIKRLVNYRNGGISNFDGEHNNGLFRVVISRVLVRDSQAIEQSVFMYDDLEQDDNNNSFLKKGVPISHKVTYESFQDIQDNIEYEEADVLNESGQFDHKHEIQDPVQQKLPGN
jgi:hypothetical protein